MTAFSSTVFQKTVIELPTGNNGGKIAYTGILKSEKATVTASLGFDPTFAQVFTFRTTDPAKLTSEILPGSLVRVIEGNENLKGRTLKVLSVPTRPIDLRAIVGTKLTLVLEDRNYLGSAPI